MTLIISEEAVPYEMYWYKLNIELMMGLKEDANVSIENYYWLRSRSKSNNILEVTGAEYGRYWLGIGANGF